MELGVILLCQAHGAPPGHQREAQHDIRTREVWTTEVRATPRRGRKLRLQEREMRLEIRVQEAGLDLASHGTGDGLEKEGHGGILNFWDIG